MSHSPPALHINLDRARAHWHRIQGLAEPLKGTVDEVVAATGWLRTLGGVDVYLAARARIPTMRRRDLDEAVEQCRLQVVPAVRGCIYLVPRPAVPLVLRVAEEQSRKRMERDLDKAGVTHNEIAAVGEAALAVLKKGPLSTDALRKTLPAGVVRSLGERGKKIGMSSPLPSALRTLEFDGKIERTLEGGRLDTERYEWRLPAQSPFAGVKIPGDPIARYAAVAEMFFRHAGPASLKDFAAWAGLSQRDARAAVDRCPLVPVVVDGYAADALALQEHLPVLRETAPDTTSVSMLSFEDNFLVLHGGPALVTDPRHHDRKIKAWGQSGEVALGDAKHIQTRSLLIGDRLGGIWEYDPDTGKVVFATFDPLPASRRRAVEALAEGTAALLREELGHAKSFTLDKTEDVRKRAALVKAL